MRKDGYHVMWTEFMDLVPLKGEVRDKREESVKGVLSYFELRNGLEVSVSTEKENRPGTGWIHRRGVIGRGRFITAHYSRSERRRQLLDDDRCTV